MSISPVAGAGLLRRWLPRGDPRRMPDTSAVAARSPPCRRPAPATFASRLSSIVVDLCPLQMAAEIHVDALPLRERVEHRVSRFAMSVAGAARAAEGQVRLGAGGAVVDVDDPGVE